MSNATYSPDEGRNHPAGKYTGFFIKDDTNTLVGFHADQMDLYFRLEQISIIGYATPEQFTKEPIIAYTRTDTKRWQRYAFSFLDMMQYNILIHGPVRALQTWPKGYRKQDNTETESLSLTRNGVDTFIEITRTPEQLIIKAPEATVTISQKEVTITGKLNISGTKFKKDSSDLKEVVTVVTDKLIDYIKGFTPTVIVPTTGPTPISGNNLNTTDPSGDLVKSDISDELKKVFD